VGRGKAKGYVCIKEGTDTSKSLVREVQNLTNVFSEEE
jgi:hypothetical protein